MKKLLLAAVVFGLGLCGWAQGYFVGAEIIPHTFSTATYGIPYLTVGYDAGWGYAYLGLSNPGFLNTWLSIGGGGFYNITDATRVGGGLTFWIKLQDFSINTGTWSVNFLGMYKFDDALSVILRLHIPLQVDPNKFLMGMWISFGLTYYIWGNAPGNSGN